jgi:outer membrane protein assembly factor BamB
MTTDEFIDTLAAQQVVDAELARQLRAKAAEGGRRVTPEAILKFLVKTDVITQWKGDELAALLQTAAPPGVGRADEPLLDLAPIEEDADEPAVRRSRKPPIEPLLPPAPPAGAAPPPIDLDPLLAEPTRRSRETVADLSELAAGATGDESARPMRSLKLGGGHSGKKSTKKRTAGGRNQWDSPLILLGGGALALLVVAGALLYFLLFRENAAAVMADADGLFKAGAYNQAAARYAEFAQKYSSHPDASLARVQAQMSRLWQAVEGGAEPSASLALAKQVIAAVESETAFITGGEGEQGLSKAKQDLSVLLVRIGDALVAVADTATDPQKIQSLIADIEATLQLADNTKYVPDKFRNAPALAKIGEQLGVIRTRQQRDARLAATLAKMDEAIAGGNTAAAYAERLALLADFPALAENQELAAKVRAVSESERGRVKFVAEPRPAETAWPARAVVAELALAERRASPGAAASGAPVVVSVDGALYGLRSGDGALLWRRFAGLGESAAPLTTRDGGVIAAGLAAGELWRLDAETGKLVWRLPLDDRVTGITTAGDALLAAGDSGKLFVVNAATGALVGRVEFSQPIHTAPALNDRGDRIFVVGESSIIYTLAAKDYSCVGVYYLGHAKGAVVTPPLAVLNKLVVADNSGTSASSVRLLGIDKDGAVGGEVASDRLDGLVTTPLATAARRVVAATTRGQVGVYEIGGGSDKSALTVVARRAGQSAAPMARFARLADGKLWLAGQQLMKLTILPTENQLAVESMDRDYEGDAFDAPLQQVDSLLIHVRRPAGRAGAVVAATDLRTSEPAWETEIAVPAAGAPVVDAPRVRVTVVTASGAAFVLDRDALARGVQNDAQRADALVGDAPPYTASVDLGGGSVAAGAPGSDRLLLVRPDDPRQVARPLALAAPLAGGLATWDSLIVFPTEAGQVGLVDPHASALAGTPFQAELTPDRKYHWLPPAVVGAGDDAQLAVSDGSEQLFLVKQVAAPTPHLEQVRSVDVGPSPLATPLAVVGNFLIAGTEDGRLAPFGLPALAPAEPVELGGRIVWGPFPAGDGALAATDAGELVMISPEATIAWRQELRHGELAGRPLVRNGAALVLHAAGGLSSIRLADGGEQGFVELGQPATAGPVPLGERVIVAGADGALVVANPPQAAP